MTVSNQSIPIVWTIAASDSGGGAGIQADIKTFFDLGVHGCSAITAITAQNTQGVHDIQSVHCRSMDQQLQALTHDLPPIAIKIGVLPSVEIIHTVIKTLQVIDDAFVVMDTVLAPTRGENFTDNATRQALFNVFTYVDLLTPNIPEAEALTGIKITHAQSQQDAAKKLLTMGVKAVLLKGGHGSGDVCQDYFLSEHESYWLTQAKQLTSHTHGTGCTLSSAIAAFVAQGKPLRDALVLANAYICKGIRQARALGKYSDKKGAVAQTGWPDDFIDFPQVSVLPDQINYLSMPACDTMALGLYPVIDSIEWLEKLLLLGINTIQLRVKDIPADELDCIVQRAAALGREYKARLFINDYWQLAIKHNT